MTQEYTVKIEHNGPRIGSALIELVLFESIIEDSDGDVVPEISVKEAA